jgi:hypothetical protein
MNFDNTGSQTSRNSRVSRPHRKNYPYYKANNMRRKTTIHMHPVEPERVGGMKTATIRDITYIVFLCIIGVSVFKHFSLPHKLYVSPIPAKVQAEELLNPLKSPMPTNTPTPAVIIPQGNQDIVSYIYEVFGPDANKAFLLLSCENSTLNPDTVNTFGNWPPGSRDIGVFQINEYWQGVNGKFLFNWKVNVEIAHQLYVENGNQFNLWSCGKRLGI